MSSDRNEAAKLWKMISHIKFCMMTTVEEDGSLRSRPMAGIQDEFEGELWFFTRASSHKSAEVEAHHQVNLAYAEPDEQDFVSVSGPARLVRDKEKARKYWSEAMKTWFPDGIDDPDLALLCVKVEHAEYWDSPSSTMVHLYGYLKSQITGRPPKPGDNAKLNFH